MNSSLQQMIDNQKRAESFAVLDESSVSEMKAKRVG
jgi:hypothetical protein